MTIKYDAGAKKATTDYVVRIEAISGGATTLIDGGATLTMDAGGKASVKYFQSPHTLVSGTAYTFQVKLFNTGDDTAKAVPLATDLKKSTVK